MVAYYWIKQFSRAEKAVKEKMKWFLIVHAVKLWFWQKCGKCFQIDWWCPCKWQGHDYQDYDILALIITFISHIRIKYCSHIKHQSIQLSGGQIRKFYPFQHLSNFQQPKATLMERGCPDSFTFYDLSGENMLNLLYVIGFGYVASLTWLVLEV